jgi:hypothetical protein
MNHHMLERGCHTAFTLRLLYSNKAARRCRVMLSSNGFSRENLTAGTGA